MTDPLSLGTDLQPLREVLQIIDTLNKLGGLGYEKHGWLDKASDTLQAWISTHGNKANALNGDSK